MQAISDQLRQNGKRIGLVPTMGYLHDGHIRLIEEARLHCDFLIVSIFVNPVQFAPNEDFDKYPRDFEHDRSLLIGQSVDCVFYPQIDVMYPEQQKTYVITEDLGNKLCGISRPIHFRGVTTVVAKLFNIIKPHVAVFGQKDGQQALILKKMVKDLNFDIMMTIVPTVRESDGLAMSSRNKYLSDTERQAAPEIYRSLTAAKEMIDKGICDRVKIANLIEERLKIIPQFRIDYIAIVNTETLEPVDTVSEKTMIAVAVFCGKTRLIDNIMIGQN
jgi:pantoate--beta-alanine ligase